MDSAGLYSIDGLGCGYEKTCNAANRVRGICPEGWHLPSKTEWESLVNILVDATDYYLEGKDGASFVGLYLKSFDGWFWEQEDLGEDWYYVNYVGFSVTATGFYINLEEHPSAANYGLPHIGNSFDRGEDAYFWTSTDTGFLFAYLIGMEDVNNEVYFMDIDKFQGMSVRCVKD